MNLIQLFSERYGPHAFGLVSLMILWFAIVKPELDTRTVSMEENKAVVKQMNEIVQAMVVIVDKLEDIGGEN